MPETASSAAEASLENQKIGSLQLCVAALCMLVQICDGYDLSSVAWAVPSLIRSWHLAPALFPTALLWSSIGIMVGALSAGPIGDRSGRRPLLLGLAIRAAIVNHRTEAVDVDRLVDAVLAAGRALFGIAPVAM
jgi:MFS transporter, AAHS family, 4-hydroxybenzoate transporter